MDDTLARWVEEVALFWEEQGLPRIAGRIVGLLLVCDPPWRSASELAEELSVSKGSVSTMTRLLLASETIETVARPGERATFYRLSATGLERKFERRMESLTGFSALAQVGLDLLADEPQHRTARLRTVAALYTFLDREIPLLLDKWRAEREVSDA